MDCGLYVIKNVETIYSKFFLCCYRDNMHSSNASVGIRSRRSNESKILFFISEVVGIQPPYGINDIQLERKNIAILIERCDYF